MLERVRAEPWVRERESVWVAKKAASWVEETVQWKEKKMAMLLDLEMVAQVKGLARWKHMRSLKYQIQQHTCTLLLLHHHRTGSFVRW